jgi:hypothetical protein
MVDNIKRIQLTDEGEILKIASDYTMTSPLPDSNTRLGVHEVCYGDILKMNVSESSSVLVCQRCGLRVYVSRSLKTFGGLKDYLDKILILRVVGLEIDS